MSNVRNWASGLATAALILLAPIIGFAVIVTAEMLTDLLARLSPPRSFGPSPLPHWVGFCCANTAGRLAHLDWGRRELDRTVLCISAARGYTELITSAARPAVHVCLAAVGPLKRGYPLEGGGISIG
jgi:hypothetical protein